MEREHVIQVETYRGKEEVHIVERGEGNHVCIAWHGAGSNNYLLTWDELLSEGKVVLAGLPGHGPVRSYDRAHYLTWEIEEWIDIGVEIARKYYNNKPLTLIGYSFGGMVAVGVAQRVPEFIGRVILVAPTISKDVKGVAGLMKTLSCCPSLCRTAISLSMKPVYNSFEKYKKSMLSFVTNKQGYLENPDIDSILNKSYEALRRSSLQSFVEAYMGTWRLHRLVDLRPDIEKNPINIPVLVLHGEKDKIIPFKQSQWLVNILPQAELAAIPDSGHMCFFENEKVFNEKLKVWINHHPVK